MRTKLLLLLLLVGVISACGPAYSKKYYMANSQASTAAPTPTGTGTGSTTSDPAPVITVTVILYNEQGQPVVVQQAPTNISIIVSTTVLYTADGTPVVVQVCQGPPFGKAKGQDE